MPDLRLETESRRAGHDLVAGVDESGRGCLAGPVLAAAVILPDDADIPGLDDCKVLPPERREELLWVIRCEALAIGVGRCEVEEIDDLNILWASLEAMRRALLNLAVAPAFALVDGNREIPGCPCPQRTVIGGDGASLSIAAASVVAKVTRDHLMATLDEAFPQYGFVTHKGYATPRHYAALGTHGPSPHHRKSFRLA